MNETKHDRAKSSDLKMMLKDEQLELDSPQEWDEIVHHIEVHRYLINQNIPWKISWADAVFSWYENVFAPIRRAVEAWEIKAAFPDRSMGQLYLAVATHWHFLKESQADVLPEEAARDFSAHYGQGLARWFSRFLQPRIN